MTKEAINNDRQADKKARAKRADLEAANERFAAIRKVLATIPVLEDKADNARLVVIDRIATGASLDDIITEAGRAALGLE